MTRPSADIVKVTWSGSGTATMTLGSAVSGFTAFPSELDGQLVSYSIEHQASPEREAGIGTYTHSGTTLTREFVTRSTNPTPTAKVSFSSGTKHVRLTTLGNDIFENRAATNPTTGDDRNDGYVAGRSRWFNTTTEKWWICLDDTVGSAVWGSVFTSNDYSTGIDGQVLTVQADGTVAPETPSAATVNVSTAQVVMRTAAGTGSATGHGAGNVTEKSTPVLGDYLLGWRVEDSAIRKFPHAPLADTAVSPGTYFPANITVDEKGRITAASNDEISPAHLGITPGGANDVVGFDGVGNFVTRAESGGGGGLSYEANANTAITLGSATDGKLFGLTADSSITLTLDAQASVGTHTGFVKLGAGAVTVSVEGGAGYWVEGDDIGGTAATASFTMTGSGEALVITNTDGNSAKWLVGADTNLAKTIDGAITANGNVTLGASARIIGQVEQFTGMISVAANQSYRLDQSAAYPYTVNSLIIISGAGTCTAKLTIETVDVTGISAVSVSTTEAIGTASAANSVAIGDTLRLAISSNAGALDVCFTVKVTRA